MFEPISNERWSKFLNAELTTIALHHQNKCCSNSGPSDISEVGKG